MASKTFLRLFNKTLDKHVQFKQVNPEDQKEALKPWITMGIKKSIRIRGKLYKEMVKEKDRVICEEKEKKLKKDRNKTA